MFILILIYVNVGGFWIVPKNAKYLVAVVLAVPCQLSLFYSPQIPYFIALHPSPFIVLLLNYIVPCLAPCTSFYRPLMQPAPFWFSIGFCIRTRKITSRKTSWRLPWSKFRNM